MSSNLDIAMSFFHKDDMINAELYFEKIVNLEPNNPVALNNLASSFQYRNELEKATTYYKKALSIDPHYALSLYNLSLILLMQKEYKAGFNLYRFRYTPEVRGESLGGVAYPPLLLTPKESIENKKVYISHEQGLGDTIQFIRFIPFFIEKNAQIISYVPESLKKLFEYNYPEVDFIFSGSDIAFDYNFPMLESPYLLEMEYENIPYGRKYLSVNHDDSMAFRKKHNLNTSKKKIGINYRGSQGASAVKNRSIELEMFLNELNKLDDSIEIYSLQYERTQEDEQILEKHGIENLGKYIVNFYDTALMIDNMDLIISIDTSLLHLAGAMGKKSIVMLKFSPDWRWGLESHTTKWYESVTMLRQKSAGDWESLLKQLKESIKL